MTKKILLALAPLAAFAIYTWWVLWLDGSGLLPNPLATHWGFGGQPNGFSGISGHLTGAAIAFAIPGILWSYAAFLGAKQQPIRRLLQIISAWTGFLISGLMIYFVAIQIGKADSAEIVLPGIFNLVFFPVILLIAFLMLANPKISISSALKIQLRGITFLKLDFSDIQSVSSATIGWKDFGGLGLRFRKNKVAFIPSSGQVVVIKTKAGTEINVRSNNVKSAVALIESKI